MIIPALRNDLRLEFIEEDGESLVVYFDDLCITKEPIAIPKELHLLIKSFDGKMDELKFTEMINKTNDSNTHIDGIINLIRNLEYLGFMETPAIEIAKRKINNYLDSPLREAICNGNTYPDNPQELELFIDDIMKISSEQKFEDTNIILSPHIDFRIGDIAKKVYSDNYNSIKNNKKVDLIIIMGTSHNKYSDYLMFTKKHFQTPLGITRTDINLIEELEKKSKYPVMIDDLAHYNEHSIELHIVMLQRLFGTKAKILPILTASFHEFIENDIYPEKSERIQDILSTINELTKNKNVLYIASGDLAHIGRKFNDDFDAESKLESLYDDDAKLIKALKDTNKNKFFDLISGIKDKNKVCGLSPFYLMLQLTDSKRGEFLSYGQWNEMDTKSAVSFAGLSLFK